MFKNYFKTGVRVITRNKIFSFINVLGLAIGIAASLVIFLIVAFEFGFDKYEPAGEKIYRVVMDMKFDGADGHSAAIPAPLTAAVQREVTGVEAVIPVMTFQGDGNPNVSVLRPGSVSPVVFKKQEKVIFTGEEYFTLMPHKWLAGSEKISLAEPFNVVLSESRALQYFPGLPVKEVLGKTITYNDDIDLKVSGIVEDLNERTTPKAEEFLSFATIAKTHLQKDFMMDVWNDWMAYSQLYVKLFPDAKPQEVQSQLKSLLDKYNKEANARPGRSMVFTLQPLRDVHFDERYAAFNQRVAHTSKLYGLLAIATFLLLLGCINFINLNTANATHRSKEIGIRKTLGSSKRQLVIQFLSETFVLTSIAGGLAVAFTPLLLRLFGGFTPPGLSFTAIPLSSLLFFLFTVVILVSLLSGIYPALVLSGYKPVLVLKNQSAINPGETRHAWIRKSLTVSQFVIAQFFVIATFLVGKQINFSINSDLGFRKEALLNLELPDHPGDSLFKQRVNLFMNKLSAVPGIQLASQGFLSPATEGAAFGNIRYVDADAEVKNEVQVRWGDENYLKVYNIPVIAGRNVLPNDSIRECLVNETYARMLGFRDVSAAVNKQLYWNDKSYMITGVMHDFHEGSTHRPIGPIVFKYGTGNFLHIALRPNTASWSKTIAQIGAIYKSLYPKNDYAYTFFDDTIAKFYEQERETATLLRWATGLSIFISCLGLLGLVMFTVNTRVKEIGIRKVLGAKVINIIMILSNDFVKLVAIAFLITVPIAWWALSKWLDDFAYKTTLSWWVFAICGLGMLFIALVTLSVQTVKAAIANPVKSLRTE